MLDCITKGQGSKTVFQIYQSAAKLNLRVIRNGAESAEHEQVVWSSGDLRLGETAAF